MLIEYNSRRIPIQPNTLVLYQGKQHMAKGVHNNGMRVMLDNRKSVAVSKVTVILFPEGWKQML